MQKTANGPGPVPGCRRLPTARAQSHRDVTGALTLLSEGPTTTPRFRGPSACRSYRVYRRPRSLWGALTLPDPVCEDAVRRQPLILPPTPPPLSRVSTWPSRGSRTARIRHVRACRSHVAAALGGGAAHAGAPEPPRHAPRARKSSPDFPRPGRTRALFLPCGLRAASQGKGRNGVSRAHKSGVGYRESSGARENGFTKRWLHLSQGKGGFASADVGGASKGGTVTGSREEGHGRIAASLPFLDQQYSREQETEAPPFLGRKLLHHGSAERNANEALEVGSRKGQEQKQRRDL
ncbi:unnamed protein product [Rangifer tarandus platyrhynchus]|uniref:Uncharacterized protein n=2 Tax=Rangifer tarandus platyrhynchus TaxID=3082113 RepID=A0ABN8YIY7_RANTA|nr:unnamed protein product [Rangifer tarandus platyrhynchus]CAI9697489.1 unnamed protein product [Rangifer tarandus platyrhynchus]